MSKLSVENLLHIKELEQLKSRYCRAIDNKLWNVLPELFAPDARFEGFALAQQGATVQVFVSELAKRLSGAITAHHCHLPDFRIFSADFAKGIWAMMDYNEWPEPMGFRGFPDSTGFCGYGFYEESYQRINGVWRIAFMRLARVRVDPLVEGARSLGFSPFATDLHFRKPSPDWLAEET